LCMQHLHPGAVCPEQAFIVLWDPIILFPQIHHPLSLVSCHCLFWCYREQRWMLFSQEWKWGCNNQKRRKKLKLLNFQACGAKRYLLYVIPSREKHVHPITTEQCECNSFLIKMVISVSVF